MTRSGEVKVAQPIGKRGGDACESIERKDTAGSNEAKGRLLQVPAEGSEYLWSDDTNLSEGREGLFSMNGRAEMQRWARM
jgi:hypothetical protein